MRNWLIRLLGGKSVSPWEGGIPGKDIHCHIHFNDQQIKMLADYVMGGVFFNMRTRPGLLIKKSRKKSANITEAQLHKKILKYQKPY